MAAQMSPLRRWKRFFGAFDSVDAAIEVADPDLYRDWLRRARGDIFEGLCNAADDGKAEQLCGVLDNMMAEALETLRLVPVASKLLVSTDLAESVRALQEHESERVRVLAGGIVGGWRASVQDHAAKVTEALHKLHDIKMLKPKETVGQQRRVSADPDAKTMEAAKRKLHEGYRQAEDAKRRRRVQVVESPEMLKQRRRKMHPILRERSLARCASSMVKKSLSLTKQIHMGS